MAKKDAKSNNLNEQEDLQDLLKRTQASFENFKKQTEKRMLDMRSYAAKDIITKFLPILDNFELALKNANDPNQEFIKGIELIYAQCVDVLSDAGAKPFKTEGEKFDPYKHEALMKVPSDKEEDIIIEEFQKGYELNGTIIRHAKVKVSAGKQNNNTTTEEA